ncbi:MAG: hypothetical protein ACE5DZ_07235 [Mariprofundus sp.]
MIGIDTNVLVRYIVQDDERQASGCEYTITFDKKAPDHRLFRLLK